METITEPTYSTIPRPTTDLLPDWYTSQSAFIRESVNHDTTRLEHYLTQMNVGASQTAMALAHTQTTALTMYELDFKSLLTSLYFDIYRNTTQGDYIKNKEIPKLAHSLSNGDEIIEIERRERYGDDTWKRVLNLYGKITEGVIEAHTASVLAQQNRMRKQRADAFTEEEQGLNRLYREFQLGRQFKSMDEIGMEIEVV